MKHVQAALARVSLEAQAGGKFVHFHDGVASIPNALAADFLSRSLFCTLLADLSDLLKTPGKVISLRRGGNVGDLLMITPLIRTLVKRYGCTVDVFTLARCAPVLANNPHIRAVYRIDLDEISHAGYDACIDLDQYKPHDESGKHAVQGFVDFLEMGIELDSFDLEYFPAAEELQIAQEGIDARFSESLSDRPLIAYAWRATHDMRSLTPEKNFEVLTALEHLNCRVVLLDAEPIDSSFIPKNLHVWNAGGALDFREYAALISLSNVVVTPDSGPLHLASAMKVPTVAFMSTHPPEERVTQKEVVVVNEPSNCPFYPCRGYRCFNRRLPDNLVRCLDFAPERAAAAVVRCLNGVGSATLHKGG